MKEKIKKILLWLLFIFFILGFINTVMSIFTFPAERATLEAEGVELAYPELTIALNFIWLFLFGGIIFIIYKKLFPKKGLTEEKIVSDKEDVFQEKLLSKILFVFHFLVLIFAFTQFILGNWKLGIFAIIVAISIAYIAYRISGWRQMKLPFLSPEEKERMKVLEIEMNKKMKEKLEEIKTKLYQEEFSEVEKELKKFHDESYPYSYEAVVDKQIFLYRTIKKYHPEMSENEILNSLIFSRIEAWLNLGIDESTVEKLRIYYAPIVSNSNKSLKDVIYAMVYFEYIVDRPPEMPPISNGELEECLVVVRDYIRENMLEEDDEIARRVMMADLATSKMFKKLEHRR